MSEIKVNHEAWAQSCIGFIRERGLEEEFKDWCGGWGCPVRSPTVDNHKHLSAALGYLTNARIDLETGAPKKTAICTIDGGIRMIREAIKDHPHD